MTKKEIKILLWLFVGVLIALSALGLAGKAGLNATLSWKQVMSPPLPPLPSAESAPAFLWESRASGPKCPLSRV